MKERPILFNGDMVRAILDGSKTQTRRPMSPQPTKSVNEFYCVGTDLRSGKLEFITRRYGKPVFGIPLSNHSLKAEIQCPFGQPGDVLWVRETWAESGYNRYEYRAAPADGSDFRCVTRWRPSIHMPKKAARIKLRVKRVWIERIQDISEADAKAEGTKPEPKMRAHRYRYAFGCLWDSIYKTWSENPFVWACEFERIES